MAMMVGYKAGFPKLVHYSDGFVVSTIRTCQIIYQHKTDFGTEVNVNGKSFGTVQWHSKANLQQPYSLHLK